MSEQTVRIMCPNLMCRTVLAVPADTRGRTVRCRNCGLHVRVPQKAEAKKPQGEKDAA